MNGSFGSRRCLFLMAVGSLLLFSTRTVRATTYLDQWFDPTCNPNMVTAINGATPNVERAQTFLPTVSGPLTRVDVYMENNPPPVGNIIMDIRGTVAGLPDPAVTPAGVLATATIPGTLTVSLPAHGWVTFNFAAPAMLVAGQEYAIVVRGAAGASVYGWDGSSPGAYPQGAFYQRTLPAPPTWTVVFPGSALGFRTFVGPAPYPAVPAPCTPSPPPGVFGGYSTGSGGGGGTGGGAGAAGNPGEGSFLGTQDPTFSGGEGSFGAHLAAPPGASQSLAALPPILVGPFAEFAGGGTVALATTTFANAPGDGVRMYVFNGAYRQQAQPASQQASSGGLGSALIWGLLAILLLGAAFSLATALQRLASFESPSNP